MFNNNTLYGITIFNIPKYYNTTCNDNNDEYGDNNNEYNKYFVL